LKRSHEKGGGIGCCCGVGLGAGVGVGHLSVICGCSGRGVSLSENPVRALGEVQRW
jgi:hypothetical protein